MSGKTVPIPILIFIWLTIIGGVFWWWQGRGEKKEAEPSTILEKSGQAAISETETFKTKPIEEPGTPGEVAVAFFDYLNQKRYSEAEKLLTPEALNLLNSEGGLKKIWEIPPSASAEHPVGAEVSEEEIDGDTSKVWLFFYFSGGEKVKSPEPINLIKVKGSWKLSSPY